MLTGNNGTFQAVAKWVGTKYLNSRTDYFHNSASHESLNTDSFENSSTDSSTTATETELPKRKVCNNARTGPY